MIFLRISNRDKKHSIKEVSTLNDSENSLKGKSHIDEIKSDDKKKVKQLDDLVKINIKIT